MMKRLIFIGICLLSQVVQAQELNLSWIEQDARLRAARVKAFAIQKSMNTGSLPSGMDIKFHRMELALDPTVRFIRGSVTTRFIRTTVQDPVIRFDMHDSLHVTEILHHGIRITGFTHENNKLTIPLPVGPSENLPVPSIISTDSVKISYQGIPVDDALGSFSIKSHAGVPILSTFSEPYGARDWWPCSQDLNDKIDSIELVITVPPGNRAAANGVLVSEEQLGDRSVFHWKHNHPIAAYLIGISVTNYAVYSDYVPVANGNPIEILNYVYPETLETVRSQTPAIIHPFQLYNELFGLYPYADERYGHAQWQWGGGMEHQTMSFMGSFGYDLMAHELGHQWFGDFITCGSWRDIWLNEGFATYMTGLCYERDQGGIYWEPFKRLSINRVLRKPDGSVYCYDTTDVDRIFDDRLSYSKGAIVLHMLRWEMGDKNFFRALNDYLHDPLHANGYATTEDLISHAEAAADTSFREFFNDWVYGQGYPTYELGYRQDSQGVVEMEITQEQSDPSVSFFEMDVPVRLYEGWSISMPFCTIPSAARFSK
jgi:aminopeptidase N